MNEMQGKMAPFTSVKPRAGTSTVRGFIPFECASEQVGWLRTQFANELHLWPDYFDIHDDRVVLSSALRTPAARTAALARCVPVLAQAGIVTGWRNENCTIPSSRDGTPLFEIERAAMRRFGLTAYGANLNGYVRNGTALRMWVARRSQDKPIDPGLLDNLVGGGIASGYSARETLLKECDEEAGIPRNLVAQARAAGAVRSLHEVPEGLHSEIVYVYDLLLPPAFVPTNRDGEVSGFCLASIDDVLAWLQRGDFTVEAGLVAHDFVRRQHLEGVAM